MRSSASVLAHVDRGWNLNPVHWARHFSDKIKGRQVPLGSHDFAELQSWHRQIGHRLVVGEADVVLLESAWAWPKKPKVKAGCR